MNASWLEWAVDEFKSRRVADDAVPHVPKRVYLCVETRDSAVFNHVTSALPVRAHKYAIAFRVGVGEEETFLERIVLDVQFSTVVQVAVVGSEGASGLSWYRNRDGKGSFSEEIAFPADVVSLPVRVHAIATSDIDSDGDLDVLSIVRFRKLVWHENLDGKGRFGAPTQISSLTVQDVAAGDLDGDGDTDLVLAEGGSLVWYANLDGQGRFEHERTIDSGGFHSIVVGDVDQDGDLDVVAANGSTVNWYENTDGRAAFGSSNTIHANADDDVDEVLTGDMDGDGDIDVLSRARRSNVSWFENVDGNGMFGEQRVIALHDSQSIRAFALSDIDQDGDLDVATGEVGTDVIKWYSNRGRADGFSSANVVTTSFPITLSSLVAADIDGDGDTDFVSAASDTISVNGFLLVHANTDGLGSFSAETILATSQAIRVRDATTADLDGDNDLDVVYISGQNGDRIVWMENQNGQGAFGEPSYIDIERDRGFREVDAADVDGDGDLDVLSAAGYFHLDSPWGEISWFENLDGQGTFGSAHKVADGPYLSFHAVDLDQDGDLDFIGGSRSLRWFEKTDTGYEEHTLAFGRANFLEVGSGDVDDDGDVDILYGSTEDTGWFERLDDNTFVQRVLQPGEGRSIGLADLEFDGDTDLFLVADRSVFIYRNRGDGTYSINELNDSETLPAKYLTAADLDRDGDMDLAVATEDRVVWLENDNAVFGNFETQRLVSARTFGVTSLTAEDIDGDGSIDLLTTSYDDGRIAWHENRITGDANDDGVFNSSDLVRVFQAGKYENGIPNDTNYIDSDWNGDLEFDSADLVFAFQAGTLVADAMPAEREIAAAVDCLFAHEEKLGRRTSIRGAESAADRCRDTVAPN